MAEVLASLKKIGGSGEQYTETVLWTNPSPSSNFAAQTITLSDSLSNYKYIGIRFKIHNTHASTPNATGIMLVSEFVQNRKNTGTDRRNILVASQNTNNATMARNAWYVSDTSIEFSVAYQISSTNTNTSYVIPLEILGINELAHAKGFDETTLWENSSPTADFANQTVTLSESINNYDYIKFTWKRAKADSLEGNLLVPSDVLNRCRDGQNDLAIHIGASNTTPQTFGRIIQKVSDTSVVFGSCFRTTTSTRANDMCIPLGIIGCNFR